MNTLNLAFNNALTTVENNIEQCIAKEYSILLSSEETIQNDSTLDGWDYCFALAIGLAGVFIATNKKFAEYLDEIHKAASGAGGDHDVFQAFLGTKLHHEGDYIDAIEHPFKNRRGENAYCLFHRLLWGHDILSFGEDNPFRLMFKQKGLGGILQAVRHLIADTASKQGLPLPGSSHFDFVDDRGKISNYLISISQQLSEETFGNKANAQEIYAHMMTIRAQDISAGVVVKLMSELYFKIRKIDDELKKHEITFIAYGINFIGEAVVGAIRQNGVPYINTPIAIAMGTSFAKFCCAEHKQMKQLTANTERLTSEVELLCDSYDEVSALLPKYDSSEDIIKALDFEDYEEDEQ